MDRTEVNVTTKISLYDVLNALALLANIYPMERVAEYQIERIEASARVLRERMKDYPIINEKLSTLLFGVERRVNAPSRRKVNDWAHPNRTNRIASYGPNGRRSTDRESYTMLPSINVPPPMVETNQDRTKRIQ